jgi:hypothetical protein
VISQVERLCTRGKYLEIKENAHELPCDILAFLPEESKSLRKESVNSFFIIRLIKEKDRDKKEFRAFDKIIFFTVSTIILFTLSFRMLRVSRLFRFFIFFKSKRRYLRNRRARVSHSVI